MQNLTERLAGQLTGLRDALEDTERERDRIGRELAEATEDCRRLRRAIELLSAPVVAAPKPKAKAKPKANNEWRPSEERLNAVRALLAEHGPLTCRQVEAGTGLTHSTVDRVLRVLRDDQHIRLAGRNGMANIYDVMPSVVVAA